MPKVETCSQHRSCLLVTEKGKVEHRHGHPTTEDVAVRGARSAAGSAELTLAELERASQRLQARSEAFRGGVVEAERVAGIRFDKTVMAEKELRALAAGIQGEAARGRALIREAARTATEAVSQQVGKAASAIDSLTQDIERRLAKGRQLLAQGADRLRAQVAEAKASLHSVARNLVSEYGAYSNQLNEERTRLILARQAFSEEAKAASDKLRADAKGIIDAAHSELKTLAALKESLEAQVRDLLRSAEDAKQAVGAVR